MLEVRELEKRFGAVRAVDRLSFRAENGQTLGLLGPNGAGKTTALRILYGLLEPDAGAALVDGVDVSKQPGAARAGIGVLPDQRGLYPRLTPREHARYFGRLHGLSGAPLERRIDELVELLDMRDIAERRAQGFSQGERARVAILRALVHGPRNVVLDEPTNGLDVMATRSMRELIRRLRDAGHCVLFSSHVMQEVGALCDRIVVVARGRVVSAGTPAELLTQTGANSLEDAFVSAIGSSEGLAE